MITKTNYYLDLDCLSDYCSIKIDNPEIDEQSDENTNTVSAGIDVFKYEIIKMCVDRLIFGSATKEMESEIMAMKKGNSDDDITFDLAFNTLYAHKIIKEYE